MIIKIKELLNKIDENKLNLYHMIFCCFNSNIVSDIVNNPEYNINSSKIDIKMLINDKEIDFKDFITKLTEMYEKNVIDEAKTLVNNKTNNIFDNIADKLTLIQNKVEELESNINWEDNPNK